MAKAVKRCLLPIALLAMMLIVPQFVLAKWLGLIDTLPGLVVFYVAGNLALNTFLLRGFFEALPGTRPDQGAPQLREVFHLEDQLRGTR